MSKLRILGEFTAWKSRRGPAVISLAVVFWSLLLFAYFSYAG